MRVEAISAATADDAAGIATLHAQFFSPPWMERDVIELLAHPGSAGFVIRDESAGTMQLSGYALGRVAADEAELLSICVASERRRSGIGRRLVETVADRTRSMGAARLFLEVSAENSPAIALYRELDFREIGLRRGYYHPVGRPAEDAILLARNLLPNPDMD